MDALSLFSGCGGLDLGVEQAGFNVRLAVEQDSDACDSLAANFPDLVVVQDDIWDLLAPADGVDRILEKGGFQDRPDLLVGGPPCKAFSKSGNWLEWKRKGLDPQATLLQAYTHVLREARPRRFILENVYGLTYRNRASGPAFERLQQEIRDAGYDYQFDVVLAACFGAPQKRPRLFVVGAEKGQPLPVFPEPTHGGSWERRKVGPTDRPFVTAAEALDGIDAPAEVEEVHGGMYAGYLDEIPPGGNYLHYTDRRGHPNPKFEWRSRYWNFLLKLDPNDAAPTIQAEPGPNVGPFHWDNRRLRAPEAQALFGYPAEFKIGGNRRSIQRQLGNSVPPPLAKAVAAAVADSLG